MLCLERKKSVLHVVHVIQRRKVLYSAHGVSCRRSPRRVRSPGRGRRRSPCGCSSWTPWAPGPVGRVWKSEVSNEHLEDDPERCGVSLKCCETTREELDRAAGVLWRSLGSRLVRCSIVAPQVLCATHTSMQNANVLILTFAVFVSSNRSRQDPGRPPWLHERQRAYRP